MRPGDAPSDDGPAEKRFAYLYTIVRTNAYAPGVNSARKFSCQARAHLKANTRVFGSFNKTLVINRLDKTASQNILFHITGKPVPHARKGFSATSDRLFRDLTKAFPECKTCFCEPSYTSLYPEKQFLPCIERHFYAYHDAFIRLSFSVSRFSTVKIFYFRFCIFMHKTDCARLPESRFSLPLPALFHT